MPDGGSSKELRARAEELSSDKDIAEQAEKLYAATEKAFEDQRERTDKILDNWDMYECQLGRYQNYSGMSKIYLPIVRNAVNALVVRYINQSFPSSARHVECVTGEKDRPYAMLSLIEHYIAESKLRTQAATELLVNGQVEGQYNGYFNWNKIQRTVVSREKQPIKVDGVATPEAGELTVTIEETIEDSCPGIEVLHDADVAVFPATVSSVDEALECGGGAAIARRWTKATIEKMRDEKEISESVADDLIEKIGEAEKQNLADTEKKLASSAGIQVSRKKAYVLVYEVWHKFDLGDEEGRRLCRAFFTGDKECASVKRNPHWNDRCPLHSAPLKRLPGVFKGEASVSACMDMQVLANDLINEAADMQYYCLAPIVTADPQKVSKWKELVADIGAVWPVNPDGVKIFEWPNKVREALEMIGVQKTLILETLQVNPGNMPQQTGKPGAKRNQAEIALEQQVDILQTSDAVTVFEQEILTPWVQWAAELDHQHRDKDILVREYGETGLRAGMEEIPPIQWGKRWEVRWVGVEAQRNVANIQQMISFANVIQQVPPEMLGGRKVDIVPLYDFAAGVIFGPTLARQVWVNAWEDQSIPPDQENEMLAEGFEVMTHAGDDDMKHIREHMQLPESFARNDHIEAHKRAIAMKQRAQMMAQMQAVGMKPPQDQKPKRPRRAQGSRPGAQAQPPRMPFGPSGAIRPDRLPAAGGVVPPRKTA